MAIGVGEFCLFLAAAIILVFPGVVFGFEMFATRDFAHFSLPLAYFQRDCFWHGFMPLWNPLNYCGVPFLAQWNTMSLYPGCLLYLVLPFNWAVGAFCLIHLWFAGVGMYILARRFSGSTLGAAIAGLAYAFSGLLQVSIMWPSTVAALSWLPWIMLSASRAWLEGGRRIIFAAFAGAAQMLAGAPEAILFTWLLVGAVWLADILNEILCLKADSKAPFTQSTLSLGSTRNRDAAPKLRAVSLMAGRLALVVFLVSLLAAVQLLPTFDLIVHSQREKGYTDMSWAMPIRGWVNSLVPLAFAHRWIEGTFFQAGQGWLSSVYCGSLTLGLALVAISVRSLKIWVLVIVWVLAYLCALGANAPILPFLTHLFLPLSTMRYPVKYMMICNFITPLFASVGTRLLQSKSQRDKRRGKVVLVNVTAVLLATIGCILIWTLTSVVNTFELDATFRNGLQRAAFLIGMAVLLWFSIRQSNPRARSILSISLLMFVWLDLRTHVPNLNRTVPAAAYDPGIVASALALNPQPGLGNSRVMISPAADVALNRLTGATIEQGLLARRLGLFSDFNLLDGIPKVDGLFALYPREIAEVVSLLYASTNTCFPQILDFLGVSHTTAPGEFTTWQVRESARPLLTAGQKPIFASDPDTLMGIVNPNFDSCKCVFLPLEVEKSVSARLNVEAKVRATIFDPEKIAIDVEAAAPTLVVIAQTYYHCWHPYVDEKPAALLRANYAFQAVQVPQGRHKLHLIYKDRMYQAGKLISLITAALCLIAVRWRSQPSSNCISNNEART